MIREKVRLVNRLGLHARAASRLVQTAASFESQVWLERDGKRVNGKSIMGVLTLAAPHDAELSLEISGPDEDRAAAALRELFSGRFGETE